MSQNLREDIQEILKLNMPSYQAEMQTNTILKIITKRIDEFGKKYLDGFLYSWKEQIAVELKEELLK